MFATVVVLTLALGIGANTAIFSVVNEVLLRLLPVRDPARIVYIATTSSGEQSGDGDTSITEYTFEQLRTQKQIFSDLVAFAPLMVSGNYFSGLGVRLSGEGNHRLPVGPGPAPFRNHHSKSAATRTRTTTNAFALTPVPRDVTTNTTQGGSMTCH